MKSLSRTLDLRKPEKHPHKSLFEEILTTLGKYPPESPRRKAVERDFWSPQKRSLPALGLTLKQGDMIVLGNRLRTKSTRRLEHTELPSIRPSPVPSKFFSSVGSKPLFCLGTAYKSPH